MLKVTENQPKLAVKKNIIYCLSNLKGHGKAGFRKLSLIMKTWLLSTSWLCLWLFWLHFQALEETVRNQNDPEFSSRGNLHLYAEAGISELSFWLGLG